MYKIYLGGVQFPVAPSKIETTIEGQNKTINLINEAEVNMIKGLKLADYSFSLLLPNSKYPFADYDGQYRNSTYYLTKLENLKKKKKPFDLVIVKAKGKVVNNVFQNVVQSVTLEKYTITDEVEEGYDIVVNVELKAYKEYGVTKVKVKKNTTTNKVTYTKIKLSTTKKKIVNTYTTKAGQTFWNVAKQVYGKSTLNNAKAIYSVNKSNKKLKDLKYVKNGKVTSNRLYTKDTLPKGVKLTIPQNKK